MNDWKLELVAIVSIMGFAVFLFGLLVLVYTWRRHGVITGKPHPNYSPASLHHYRQQVQRFLVPAIFTLISSTMASLGVGVILADVSSGAGIASAALGAGAWLLLLSVPVLYAAFGLLVKWLPGTPWDLAQSYEGLANYVTDDKGVSTHLLRERLAEVDREYTPSRMQQRAQKALSLPPEAVSWRPRTPFHGLSPHREGKARESKGTAPSWRDVWRWQFASPTTTTVFSFLGGVVGLASVLSLALYWPGKEAPWFLAGFLLSVSGLFFLAYEARLQIMWYSRYGIELNGFRQMVIDRLAKEEASPAAEGPREESLEVQLLGWRLCIFREGR